MHQIPTLGLNLGAAPGRCWSRLRLAPPLPHTSGLSSSEAAAEGWTRGGRTDRQTDRQTVTALQARRRTPVAEPAAAAGSVFSWGSYSKYLKLIKRLKCSHAGDSFGAFLEEISVSSVRLSVPWSWEGSHPKALLCAVQRWSRSSLVGLALPWGPQTPLCFALLPPALPCPMGRPQLCPTSQQPHSGPCPSVRCPHGRGPTRGPWWGQPVCPTTCCLASSLLVREPEMPKPLILQFFQLTKSKEIPTSGNAEWRWG